VILQSYCPEHPQIEELITESYETFALTLLEERKSAKTPPFSFQAKIQAESPNSYISRDFINDLLISIKKNRALSKELRLVGPLPSIMGKKSGVFRWEVNVFSTNRKSLHEFLDLSQVIFFINSSTHLRQGSSIGAKSLLFCPI